MPTITLSDEELDSLKGCVKIALKRHIDYAEAMKGLGLDGICDDPITEAQALLKRLEECDAQRD